VLIDWFTVVAQIVNFLILIFLLKYFLYDRVIEAMDRRNEKIRARLEQADQKEAEAAEEKESYLRKHREIEEKQKALLSEAKEKADVRRKELIAQAKEDVGALTRRWKDSVEKEKDAFLRDLRQMVGQKVYAVARRALKDLSGMGVEEQAVGVFLEKFQRMEQEERNQLTAAIQSSDNHVAVRTGFEVSSKLRGQITRTIHEQLAKDIEVDYEKKPEMIFGIELKLRGQKIAWSLEGYLETLEEETRGFLEEYAREEGA
jgi:F-type H+-transporting ATPase subunit b